MSPRKADGVFVAREKIQNVTRKLRELRTLKQGRITSVTFRANVQLEPFHHTHVEATRSVGTDETPEQALQDVKDFVAQELRIAKGEVRKVETPGRFRV
jgi:hypothetical protein